MRKINLIVLHCSATREDMSCPPSLVRSWHLQRGFSDIGYHYYITRDGVVHQGRPLSRQGAHVSGWNEASIGICYEGGLDSRCRCRDTRTPQQKSAMDRLVADLLRRFPSVTRVVGHRDLSPDTNGNGTVERHEWVKQCPCFDAVAEYGAMAEVNRRRPEGGGSHD